MGHAHIAVLELGGILKTRVLTDNPVTIWAIALLQYRRLVGAEQALADTWVVQQRSADPTLPDFVMGVPPLLCTMPSRLASFVMSCTAQIKSLATMNIAVACSELSSPAAHASCSCCHASKRARRWLARLVALTQPNGSVRAVFRA